MVNLRPVFEPVRVNAEGHGHPVAQAVDVGRRYQHPSARHQLVENSLQETVGVDHVLEHLEGRDEGHGPVPGYGFPSQGFQRVGRQHGACRPRRWFS